MRRCGRRSNTSWRRTPRIRRACVSDSVLIDAGQCSAAEGHFKRADAGHLRRGRVPGSRRMPIDVTTIRCGSRHASTSRSCRARESGCRGESRRRSLRRRSSAGIDPAVPSCVDARLRLQRGALQSRAGALAGGSRNRTPRARRTSCCDGCQRTRRSVARSNGCVKPPAEVANDIGPTQPMLYTHFVTPFVTMQKPIGPPPRLWISPTPQFVPPSGRP